MNSAHLPRALLLTGAATWAGVSLTTLLTAHAHSPLRFALWTSASVAFIACFLWNARRPTLSWSVLALQAASVPAMVSLLCSGYEGLLYVPMAAQLALHSEARQGLIWIGAQTLALTVATALHWTPRPALLLMPPYLGFQVLMFVAVKLFVDERRVREGLDESNRALMGLQAELAEKTRLEERLRIAQDMHDVLGHHLTALSLTLEFAAHQSQDPARATIRSAQSLARVLLRDVKALIHGVDSDVPVDLIHEMRQLARELPRPKLHIECAADLSIADADASRALFRVVQEVITNAIRHGEARNLWITLQQSADHLSLVAQDDGAVSPHCHDGFGLTSMRRRLEALGGTLKAAPATSGGFQVRAELPTRRRARA